MNKKIFGCIFVFFAGLCAFADFNRFNIPDSAEIRRAKAESWFFGDLGQLREKKSEIEKNAVGQEFQIRMEETDSTFAVVVAPKTLLETEIFTEKGVEKRTVDNFAGDSCGGWVLVKDSKTSKPLFLRIYFSQDSDEFVQFAPSGAKTLSDFVISGLYAAHSVPLGIPFEKLYTLSFEQIFSLTENLLPWKYADRQQGQFESKLQMIAAIRKNLERVVYCPDSCYDENGKPVFISSGKERKIDFEEIEKTSGKIENPVVVDDAGFLKWICDGLVEPVTGSFLYRNPLVMPTSEENKTGKKSIISQNYYLSFSLDWCRNLATAALSVKSHRNYLWKDSGVDVTLEPFASEVTDRGITQTAGYLKNSGYQIEKLKPLLFVLASTEPTYCYLAAIKRPLQDKKLSDSEIFAFDRCAVIFPLYDKNGRFNCVIFENGMELTFKQFAEKYKGSFIHLSRVLTENNFYLQ